MPITDVIIKTIEPGNIWNSLAYVNSTWPSLNQSFGSIRNLAIVLSFLFFMVQMVIDSNKFLKGGKIDFSPIIGRLFAAVLFITATYPPFYKFLVEIIISGPADQIADFFSSKSIVSFQKTFKAMFDAMAGSGTNASNFMTSTLEGSIISSILSVILVLITITFLMAVILSQQILFMVLFFIGPICLAFWFCQLTEGVAKSWISLMFATAWIGVFGSLIFTIIDSFHLLLFMSAGISKGDVFVSMIYSVLCLSCLVMIFPLASYFFDAGLVSGLDPRKTGSRAVGVGVGAVSVGAVGTVAAGVASKIAGNLASKYGGDGMSKIGDKLSQYGDKAISAGSEAYKAANPGASSQMKSLTESVNRRFNS